MVKVTLEEEESREIIALAMERRNVVLVLWVKFSIFL
jgi:hypothetical protein